MGKEKMTLYIHYNQNEWIGFEGPEAPPVEYSLYKATIRLKEYERDISEAAKNSLKILNPEVIEESDWFPYDLYKIIQGIADSGYIEWPGTYEEVRDVKVMSLGPILGMHGWILTPPAALEEESHRLSEPDFYKLIGAHPHHAIARTIWDTLEHHDYIIVKRITRKQQTK
jgi:hypothetical protein